MNPLDGIAAFVRVVDSASFSAAARGLKMSKSAVSAQVQRLEERLGVRLLNRTTRRLSVTEAGAAYYRHCAGIPAEAEAAEQAASALQREPRGTLRISATRACGPGASGEYDICRLSRQSVDVDEGSRLRRSPRTMLWAQNLLG